MNTSYGRRTQQENSNMKWSVYEGSSAHRFFEPCWDFGIHMEIIQLKMDLLETRKTENLLLLLLTNTTSIK